MAIHSAIGVILKEFIEGMSIELKILFKEFGNESLKEIFKRFAERLKKIWVNLREKWKDIIAGSFEAGCSVFLKFSCLCDKYRFYYLEKSRADYPCWFCITLSSSKSAF